MNAVEIAEAVAELVEQPFKPEEFPYSFLAAFDNPPATIERLRSGTTNNSDVAGVLQRNNIHILACDTGSVGDAFKKLRESAATTSQKAKFILATDGVDIEAEDLKSGETLACSYTDLDEKFGFFLPLANITTVREIRESSFDIKATGRLNKLYVELLKHNPEWSTAGKRHEMNHFMARLIFCFFSEDTGIFGVEDLLTTTIENMSSRDGSDVHLILSDIFKTMNTNYERRAKVGLPRWANSFPYVNGGLFSGSTEVPTFTKIARTYLLHIGKLDWTKINPDVFGSMIQAVANDEERSGLGMHYTSVPNILKVLNPLFLDDLRQQLADAANNARKLLNLRNRIKRIRVFDPACGSGNFLVIAYKEMRAIEAQINLKRGETDKRSDIPITNFRGIELFDFPAEIARLALIIAEYQCDVAYRGQKEAIAEFLPLDTKNWITFGNALRLDWLSICPPTDTGVKHYADDLFMSPINQVEIDFENEGGETYVCGNPPYRGSKWQTEEQKEDMEAAWAKHPHLARTTDFVSGWFAKYLDYLDFEPKAKAAFVTTNSICQGQQASEIWPIMSLRGAEINFAHLPFEWSNLASKNAGVTVIIAGLSKKSRTTKKLFDGETVRECNGIGPYLIANQMQPVAKTNTPIGPQNKMVFGNMPRDGGHLFLSLAEAEELRRNAQTRKFARNFVGSEELINGKLRYCIWIEDTEVAEASKNEFIADRMSKVSANRADSRAQSTRDFSTRPHRFVQIAGRSEKHAIVVPRVSSENRDYLPVDVLNQNYIVGDRNFALYDAPLWNMALVASRLHWVWIGTVCVRLRNDFSYSNTLGWNTFPIPNLTEQNKLDMTQSAKSILLAREAHFPATIADLYKSNEMPDNLRAAHEQNDELLDHIYIGRRFRNDTERLEKLFSMYTKMTTTVPPN